MALVDREVICRPLVKCQFKGTPINEALVRDLATGSFIAQQRNIVLAGGTGSGKTHLGICHRPQPHPQRRTRPLLQRRRRLEAESRNALQKAGLPIIWSARTCESSRPGTKVGASKIAPDLPIKGDTKVAAPSKKRTSGLPTGSFLRREAKNPVRAGRKPLARYGAVEGALARDLLLPGRIASS